MDIIKRVLALPYYLVNKYITKDEFKANMGYWFLLGKNDELLFEHDLKEESLVFEIGGYTGKFTENIFQRYRCTIHVFEPVSKFYKVLHEKFDNEPKVKVNDFGLGANTEEVKMSIVGDMTSSFRDEKNEGYELVKIVSFEEYINNNNIENIDLVNMNIEGGEYPLLRHLVETGLINKIDKLQVQFHMVIENCHEERDAIIKELLKTHDSYLSVPFVWDGFIRKNIHNEN